MDKRRVVRNILWNFAGNALPLLAGVVAFPLLLKGLGADRFGLLSIAWVLVGYFGLFDLGLSRAVTQVVAERTSAGDRRAASRAAATALTLMWLLGAAAAIFVWLLSVWLAKGLLEMPAEIRHEAVASFQILAVSIPFVIHTAGLRGLLEAVHAFRSASVIRMLLGVSTFAGPLIVVSVGGGLEDVMVALVCIRIAGWYAHKRAVAMHMQMHTDDYVFDRQWLKPLLAFGGWMTVTNIVSPLMVYLDRFVIGAMLSVAAISYYVVPYEVVTRAWVFSAAITGVLFPLFSANWSSDQAKSAQYMKKGALYVMLLLFPLLGILSYFAPELLGLWLGQKYAEESATVLRWLAAGTFIGGVAQIFFALVQGAGRSDWTGKLHLAEAIPYWLLLLWLLDRYGVVGAAVAYFVRTAVDALAMIWLAGKLGRVYQDHCRMVTVLALATTAQLLTSTLMESIALRAVFLAISLGVFLWFAWRRIMSVNERELLLKLLNSWRQRDAA